MQNGEQEDNSVHTDEYNYLVEYGIAKNVAAELEKIYATGTCSEYLEATVSGNSHLK